MSSEWAKQKAREWTSGKDDGAMRSKLPALLDEARAEERREQWGRES